MEFKVAGCVPLVSVVSKSSLFLTVVMSIESGASVNKAETMVVVGPEQGQHSSSAIKNGSFSSWFSKLSSALSLNRFDSVEALLVLELFTGLWKNRRFRVKISFFIYHVFMGVEQSSIKSFVPQFHSA